MFRQIIICVTLSFLVAGEELIQPGPPDSCFKTSFHTNDQYHKDIPSPEGGDFPECQSWNESSCCTLALAETLSSKGKVQGLYNFSHELCSMNPPISSGCAEYLRNEDCFYWCEPMLRYFQTPNGGNIQNVPICAEYCDAWFDACQDDYTCFENWLEEYDPSLGITTCPASHTCRTFHEVYGDGRGLCDTIWGTAYAYSTDADNCTVMAFDSTMPNPNYNLTFPRSGSLKLGPRLIHNMSVLLMVLLISADIC